MAKRKAKAPSVSDLKKQEAALEKTPKKMPREVALEKAITKRTGKNYVGKR